MANHLNLVFFLFLSCVLGQILKNDKETECIKETLSFKVRLKIETYHENALNLF